MNIEDPLVASLVKGAIRKDFDKFWRKTRQTPSVKNNLRVMQADMIHPDFYYLLLIRTYLTGRPENRTNTAVL